MSRPAPARTDSAAFLGKLRRGVVANDLRGASMIVAFSGGPDSTALLRSLHALKDELGLELHAAHLDHGLRPGASEADAAFARAFAESIGVPVTVERADTHAVRAERGLSVEAAAREARYEFMARLAVERGADCIALGHTRDDQAETVLLNVLRGSGLDGLSAMREVSSREIEGRRVTLFRPMLSVSRDEVVAYCEENGLNPRLDESNLSTEFTRNRVRLDLIPKLEEYNPAIQNALARLARLASLDMDFIRGEVERATADVIAVDSRGVSVEREPFRRLHPAIGHHLLRRAVQLAKGDTDDLELAHVSRMFGMMAGAAGKGLDLPGGLRFEVDYDRARVSRSAVSDFPMPAMESAPFWIDVPGRTVAGGWEVSVRLAENDGGFGDGETGGPRLSERFDADALGDDLLVRTRRAGDTFQPLGMKGEKKLKDFMIDARIPRRWRDSVPLVESNGRIAWVVGWRIADWAKVPPGARRVLEARFERAPNSRPENPASG